MVGRRYDMAEDSMRALTENAALRRRHELMWDPQAILREDLYQVLVLKLRKKEEEAARQLAALIEQSVRLDSPCLRDFAEFLAGKLDRDAFLRTKDSCRLFGYGSQTSKLFWIAAKAWAEGDKHRARVGFRAYLDQEARTEPWKRNEYQDAIPLSIAHLESGIPCQMPKGVTLGRTLDTTRVCLPPDSSRRP